VNIQTTMDGCGALWGLVVERAHRQLLHEQPEAAQAFHQNAPVLEESHELARALGLTEPYTKALEAGVACWQAIHRLENARKAAEATAASPGTIPGVEALILDALRIYPSAYIDSVRKFCEAALGQLIPEDDETRARRHGLRTWAAARKRILSTGRETVAHADSAFIAGIAEDGRWPPLLLLGLATEESIAEMLRLEVETAQAEFLWMAGNLLQTSLLVLAQGEAQMGETAMLLDRKLAEPVAASDGQPG